MIFINKPQNANELSVYSDVHKTMDNGTTYTKAEFEQLEAIAFFEDKDNYADNKKKTKKNFSYNVYSNDELKAKINAVFNRKCAYCESSSTAVASEDIEHFRPKKKVINQDNEALVPGYYWLGADWDNLLLSCQHCNRSKKHSTDESDEAETLGKSNYFPLRDEATRARTPIDDITKEVYLLINPCKTDPTDHIEFSQDGSIKGLTDEGEVSIEIYGLHRIDLKIHRMNAVQEINLTLLNLYDDLEDISEYTVDHPKFERTMSSIIRNTDRIKFLFADKSIYLGIKRTYLKQFINEHPLIIDRLELIDIQLLDLLP